MAYDAPPTGDDVKQLLKEAGIEVCGTQVDYDEAAAEALDIWHLETGYNPMWEGASASYKYDPPGANQRGALRGGDRLLLLRRGFTDITAVATGITPDDPVGTVLTEGTDYRLKPYNAVVDGVPFTSIEFVTTQFGPPQSIKVTGTPGYGAEIPASAFRGIVKLAGASVLRTEREGLMGAIVELKEDDVSQRKSIENIQKQGDSWEREGRRAMQRFTLYAR